MIFKATMRRNAIKLVGEKSSSLDLARGRLVLMSAIFVIAYVFLMARAIDLGLIQGEFSAVSLEEVASSEIRVAPAVLRADIEDRNGVLLATTIKTASLSADPYLLSDAAASAAGLVKIFPDLSYGRLLSDLQSEKRFVWVKRNIRPEDQRAVLELGEPGLVFEYEEQRVYPQGALMPHLLGYTDIDNKGQAGIERHFDTLLAKGENLRLSLDVRLQHILRREIMRAASEFKAKAGMGVIMDVRNGEVLAGVSWPDFNPHEAGKAHDEERFNRLTLGVYELGSVFKIFSTAAFLEEFDLPMSTSFDATESKKAGRFKISDYHAENRVLTIPEVFVHSSNIGSAMMGEAIGTKALRRFYDDLGLLSSVEFDIGEIGRPLVPNPWRDVDTLTASYGHSMATTALQTVAAVASIVNGGTLVRPHLVLSSQIGGQAGGQKSARYASDIRVVSEETAHRMRQLMRLNVTDGTGGNADVAGYRVGGKTGTAEKPINGRYDSTRLISSFMGAFPMEDPRYVIFIAIDEPKGHKGSFGYATAGWVAAPAVARVISSMGSVLGISPVMVAPEQELGASLRHYLEEKS